MLLKKYMIYMDWLYTFNLFTLGKYTELLLFVYLFITLLIMCKFHSGKILF